jgi:ADP-heptose:LPS heptosyltransferase
MQGILEECLKNRRSETTVLNPIATPHCDYPYWSEGKFDGNQSLADNLATFCKAVLHLEDVTKQNGMTPPYPIEAGLFARRVLIHPTSSKEEKNWSRKKFLRLAKELEKRGYEPKFILSQDEKKIWGEVEAPYFPTLDALAAYVLESAYFIGNDSGIGHLSSCLGLPTVTLCRTLRTARFWRPSWSRGEILTPSSYVPNIKGFRWRDRYWKELISVRRVLKTFNHFQDAK